MGNTEVKFDSQFSFSLSSDAELENALDDLISQAESYENAITELNEYFQKGGSLWTGADAEELRVTATCANGPLDKLIKCRDEINNLKNLAKGIRDAVDNAQVALKNNVKTAMTGGDENNG